MNWGLISQIILLIIMIVLLFFDIKSSEAVEVLKAFISGMIIGAIFQYFKLSIPAPPVLAGIFGIIGVYAGYKLVLLFVK